MENVNKINKSQAIREFAAKHQDMGPTAIAQALTAKGIEVSTQQVSTTLHNAAKKAQAQQGEAKPAKVKSAKVKGGAAGVMTRVAKVKADQPKPLGEAMAPSVVSDTLLAYRLAVKLREVCGRLGLQPADLYAAMEAE